ncbi:hypothetical protein [Salipiger sp.]|uniref:hypothetical protein n=1 Tax=Salipiger sp. TaxID=2078585 RepID=UPI003A979984
MDADFRGGLNVVWADNSSGKSTLMQSLLYALGFERSLGASLDVPLPFAMREEIREKVHDELLPVLQSFVAVTFDDDRGGLFSIKREVVGDTDRRLVQTWSGNLDAEYEGKDRQDFFLHDPGAAQNASGFHVFLAKKLGWSIPQVSRFDGSEAPLYMEAMFPLFFVEQKRGWSITQGPFPTLFRIQDLNRRVMEFVLDLDVGKTRRQLAELRRTRSKIENDWKELRRELLRDGPSTIKVEGVPLLPTPEFAEDGILGVRVFHNGEWQSIENAEKLIEAEIQEIETKELAPVSEASEALQVQLEELEVALGDKLAELSIANNDYKIAISERNALSERIFALREDLVQNQDSLKLKKFGSVLGESVAFETCPTCHQGLEHELLPDASTSAMGLEENIVFIKSQMKLYEALLANAELDLRGAVTLMKSLREEIENIRASIRAVKSDLVRPGATLSRADLERAVQLGGKLASWKQQQESISEDLDQFKELASLWVEVRGQLAELGAAELSGRDRRKHLALQSTTQSLLKEFNFTTFEPQEITISDTDFRPQVLRRAEDGELVEREIGFEVSASDGIRLKWAYYLSILIVCRDFGGNHIGFLVFDEPGQQQMKEVDLSSMLQWVAKNIFNKMQVNISTSENRDRVRSALIGTPSTLREFEGYVLRPVAAGD